METKTDEIEENHHEIYHLVWLDNAKAPSAKKIAIQHELRSIYNRLRNFQNENEFEEFLRSSSSVDRLILIINGQIGQKFVPLIYHQSDQIVSIYVMCADRSKHLQWTSQYPKIRAVTTQYEDLLSQISYDQSRRFRCKIDDPFLFSVFDENQEKAIESSIIDYRFVYSQMFIDYLFCPTSENNDDEHHHQLFEYLRQEYSSNEKILEKINEFQENYSSDRCLTWFTQDSFVYRLLNVAFRQKDLFILLLFQFFIIDIQKKLKENRINKFLRVYRSQFLLKKDFEILENFQGKLICFNSFLWTNLNRKSALSNLKEFSSSMNEDFVKILFEIDCRTFSNYDEKVGANVTSMTFYQGEQEVMFMLGSMFRLIDLKMDENNVWLVRLNFSNPFEEEELNKVEYIQNHHHQTTNRLAFGYLLIEMKVFHQAKYYFQHLMKDFQYENQTENLIKCCDALGEIAFEQNQYDRSLEFYQRSLQMKKSFDENDRTKWTSNYNQIGLIYLKQEIYDKAMENYQILWSILEEEENSNDNFNERCVCLNNIASIHRINGAYNDALVLYEKILSITEENLPNDHPDIGLCLMHIGMIYSYLRLFESALDYFHRSLTIYVQLVSPPHSLLGMIYENIANIHQDKNDVDEAFNWYEKACVMYEKLLPFNYSDFIQVQMVMKKMAVRL